jgi:tetratricopeptide (TPR) repeat protein
MWNRLIILSFSLILAAGVIPAQESGKKLLSQDEVYKLIKKEKDHPDVIEKAVHDQGVDFDVNDVKIEKRLRKAGATDEVLKAIWAAGPTVRNFKGEVDKSATDVPLTASAEESMGYQTLSNEPDPDKKIRMVMEFADRFPKSELLSYVFTQAAQAFQKKGDLPNAVKAGKRSLELDPDNTYSLVIVANSLAEPSMVRNSPDSNKTLQEAKVDAERALDLLPKLPAGNNETPDQLQARKNVIASDAHAALGSVAMQQDDLNGAVKEFNQAISLSQSPKPALYFRLGEIYSNAGKKQEAIQAFTKAADLGKGTAIETYANESLKELQQK